MNNPFRKPWDRVVAHFDARFGRQSHVLSGNDRVLQVILAERYRDCVRNGPPLPSFDEAEFSCYSGNGEDGIILLIFSAIGSTNKKVVEICGGDGIECNAANLVLNHGWNGLLFDGDQNAIDRGKAFYARQTNAWRFRRLPPLLVHAWITRHNVNGLIQNNGMSGEIDLLSLDMDGMDFWIWKEIACINPRVVVVEYNNRWSSQQSVTVPYSDDFVGDEVSVDGRGYFGASLQAFNALGVEKGYRLVGANMPCTNAFFMRHDVGQDLFPAVPVASCLASDYARFQHATKYSQIKDRPVVEI